MLVRTPHQGGVGGVGSGGQCWGGAWVKETWLPGASAGHEGAVPEDCQVGARGWAGPCQGPAESRVECPLPIGKHRED